MWFLKSGLTKVALCTVLSDSGEGSGGSGGKKHSKHTTTPDAVFLLFLGGGNLEDLHPKKRRKTSMQSQVAL